MAKDEERNRSSTTSPAKDLRVEDIFVTVEDPLSEDGGMGLPLGNGSKEAGRSIV